MGVPIHGQSVKNSEGGRKESSVPYSTLEEESPQSEEDAKPSEEDAKPSEEDAKQSEEESPQSVDDAKPSELDEVKPNQPNEQPTNEEPKTITIPGRYIRWAFVRKNKPQLNSITAARLICLSGGMSLGWSFGFENHFSYLSYVDVCHMKISWFLAVAIGAFIAATSIRKMTMSLFCTIASILVILNGVLLTAAAANPGIILLARYCDGIAFGLAVVAGIVNGSEQCVKFVRNPVLSFEQFGLVLGIFIYTCFGYGSVALGIIPIVYGTLALIYNFNHTMESPISYLRKGNEVAAILTLSWLQKPRTVTNETGELLKENKLLLEEDIARGLSLNIRIGLKPMITLGLLRSLVLMSLCLPMLFTLNMSNEESRHQFFFCSLFVLFRLIGVVLGMFLSGLGRKAVTVTSMHIGGALLILIGLMYTDYGKQFSLLNFDGPADTANALLCVYQIFAGIVAVASTCYLGEAFSLSVKASFIAAILGFENLIQILFFYCASGFPTQLFANTMTVVGVFQVLFGIVYVFKIPDTRRTTLREALAKFANLGSTEVQV